MPFEIGYRIRNRSGPDGITDLRAHYFDPTFREIGRFSVLPSGGLTQLRKLRKQLGKNRRVWLTEHHIIMTIIGPEMLLALIRHRSPAERFSARLCPGFAGQKQNEPSGEVPGRIAAESREGGVLHVDPPRQHVGRDA